MLPQSLAEAPEGKAMSKPSLLTPRWADSTRLQLAVVCPFVCLSCVAYLLVALCNTPSPLSLSVNRPYTTV